MRASRTNALEIKSTSSCCLAEPSGPGPPRVGVNGAAPFVCGRLVLVVELSTTTAPCLDVGRDKLKVEDVAPD